MAPCVKKLSIMDRLRKKQKRYERKKKIFPPTFVEILEQLVALEYVREDDLNRMMTDANSAIKTWKVPSFEGKPNLEKVYHNTLKVLKEREEELRRKIAVLNSPKKEEFLVENEIAVLNSPKKEESVENEVVGAQANDSDDDLEIVYDGKDNPAVRFAAQSAERSYADSESGEDELPDYSNPAVCRPASDRFVDNTSHFGICECDYCQSLFVTNNAL